MSQLLPGQPSCSVDCPSPSVVNIPGPQGDTGSSGTDGSNGIDAFTSLTDPFTMPDELATVDITVGETGWMVPGQVIAIGHEGGAAFGYFSVVSVGSSTTATVTNLADSSTGSYSSNSAPGTVFPSASKLGPAGIQGPGGSSGSSGAPTNADYVIQTNNASLPSAVVLAALPTTGLLRVTTGSGALDVIPVGVSDTQVAPNSGNLTTGRVVLADGTGIQTPAPSVSRAALELGSMATQEANNVAITGGTISGVTLPTPSGVPKNWLVFQNQQTSGTDGGSFAQASWVTVPLNTELVDTGGDGSIAGDTITLAAGTYRARWRVPAYQVDDFQSRLWNVSTAAVIEYGSNARSMSTDDSADESCGEARFTVTAGQQIRLEAQCGATNNTDGFGIANSFGGTEVYASIELEKEAA